MYVYVYISEEKKLSALSFRTRNAFVAGSSHYRLTSLSVLSVMWSDKSANICLWLWEVIAYMYCYGALEVLDCKLLLEFYIIIWNRNILTKKKTISYVRCNHRVSIEWKCPYMKKIWGAWELFLVLWLWWRYIHLDCKFWVLILPKMK